MAATPQYDSSGYRILTPTGSLPSSSGGTPTNSTAPNPANFSRIPALPQDTSGVDAGAAYNQPTAGSVSDGTPPSPVTSNPSVAQQGAQSSRINANANNAAEYLTNVTPPQTEEQIFQSYVTQNQSLIDSINQKYDAEAVVQQNENAGSVRETNAQSVSAGLMGSPDASTAQATQTKLGDDKITALNAQRSNDIQAVLGKISDNAIAQANTEKQQAETDAQTALATRDQIRTQAQDAIKTLAAAHVDWTKYKTTNPDSYNNLVQQLGGDPNVADAFFAMSYPQNTVVSAATIGSTYYQVTRDPVTGNVSSQQFDLGFTPPTGWVQNKIGTTSIVLQDPNNPANTIIYSTNPFTGGTTVSGTGSGLDILKQAGVSPNTDSSDTTAANSATSTDPTIPANAAGTGATNASIKVSSTLGVDPTTPLSDIVSTAGLGTVIAAIIGNENGSPKGVQNNPGNIKFHNLPGQIDSGVKPYPDDGGTFASYKTPEEGQQAIGAIVQGAANGKSDDYGPNPTLQDFVNKYTNSQPSTPTLDTKEYGLLANVAGFDPTKPGVDSDAMNYLNQFLYQGKTPTAASVGISTRTGSGQIFNKVAQRADDVYFKATGQHLPTTNTLTSNLALISSNNALLNTLSNQVGTVTKNFGLSLDNQNANNVNQTAPVINSTANALSEKLGSTAVAQYIAQNETLQNELGTLLSVKNASGTTVADKIAAGELLPGDASAAQQKAILKVLTQEAQNQARSIGQTTADLYKQTDPLGLDPNNPINQPGYDIATKAGFTNNYDGTFTTSEGKVLKPIINGDTVTWTDDIK